jgi:hypothetical protein
MTTVNDPTAPATFAHHNQPTPVADLNHEQIQRRPILGGLIKKYERAA